MARHQLHSCYDHCHIQIGLGELLRLHRHRYSGNGRRLCHPEGYPKGEWPAGTV
jgi:hypothetical protein